jgi:hypothetical protein
MSFAAGRSVMAAFDPKEKFRSKIIRSQAP